MDLEFDGTPARGLNRYVALVAKEIGLTGQCWSVQLEAPASLYLALDVRVAAVPAWDTALVWDEGYGWALAVESPDSAQLLAIAQLTVDPLPAPPLVAHFAARAAQGEAKLGIEPQRLRAIDADDDLPDRLAGYAWPVRDDAEAAALAELWSQTSSGGRRARVATRREASRTDTVVLRICGEVDMSTAPELADAVERALAERPAVLVLDLTGVRFFGSAGLTVLRQAHLGAAERTRIRVVATGPATLRPLRLTGVDSTVTICPTVHQALTLT